MATSTPSRWLLVALGVLSAFALVAFGLGLGAAMGRSGMTEAADAPPPPGKVAVSEPPGTTATTAPAAVTTTVPTTTPTGPSTTPPAPTTTAPVATAPPSTVDPNTLTADFEWSPSAPRLGDSISLLDRSSGNPTRWVWTWNANVVSSSKPKGLTTTLRQDTPITLTVCRADGACASTTKVVALTG